MSTEPDTVQLPRPVDELDHVLGPADPPATLVQYGDYECPYCRELHPVLKELCERTDGLRFVYRHFPLGGFHPHAARAAQAAEAAAAQGRFWEMHHVLFAEQHDLDDSRLEHCARKAGLEMELFRRAMAEGTYAEKIDEAFSSALYGGVTGTPTLFLNGSMLSNIHSLEALIEAVTAAGATLKTDATGWRDRLGYFRWGKTRAEGYGPAREDM